MREVEFEMYLESDMGIVSKNKAVKSRITKARTVEKVLNIDFDDIVINDELMYKTLLRIKNSDVLKDTNGAKQNALRKYYVFVNKKEFPTLKEYERKNKINKL